MGQTLKDDLLPLIDELHGIAGELGFRPYAVYVYTKAWTGTRPGLGALTASSSQLLVGGQNPKVREVRRKDAVSGNTEMVDAVYDIGPLTPAFAGGGIALSTVNPPAGTGALEVFFLLKGDGLPPEGLLCERVGDSLDRPLRIMVRVRSTGRKGPP